MVSKLLLYAGIACAPGLLALRHPPAAPPEVHADSFEAGCGAARELRFEMIAADAEPLLRGANGLQACLAVYRIPGPAVR